MMERDDKRLSMSLDEIIRMQDVNGDGNNSNKEISIANGVSKEKPSSNESEIVHLFESTPRSLSIHSVKHNSYNRRPQRPFYNRHSNQSFEYNHYGRFNMSFPPNTFYRKNNWNRGYNRRYWPYISHQNYHQRANGSYNYYNRHIFRSQENLNNSSGLTEENMVKFNINNSMPENGYHNKSHRSSSICSNRTGRSVRTNFSNCSRNSQRSYYSQRSFGSDRSHRSIGSNRSYASIRSFESNRSIGSNRSFGSNGSFRSNGSNRSYGSNWSNRSNRTYGSFNSFHSNRAFRSNGPRRPWVNGFYNSFRRHKNILNPAIQEDIKKIQENKSNSVLLSLELDFTPSPQSTNIPLSQRFKGY